MGDSALAGDLAAAALGDRLTGPMATVRGYALPSWATPEWTVLCSSYSGNTEETLACFEAAGGRRAGALPAARRVRLHGGRRRRGRLPGRRRAACPHRGRRRRGVPRRAG